MTMRAITLTQPYATLVAIGAKRIETRGWATSYRGPIAIHAGKGLGPVGGLQGLADLVDSEPFFRAFVQHGMTTRSSTLESLIAQLPRGAVVATARLVAIYPTTGSGLVGFDPQPLLSELAFGDYRLGRYGWLLADVTPLPEPVPARGALGLWEWDAPAEVQS